MHGRRMLLGTCLVLGALLLRPVSAQETLWVEAESFHGYDWNDEQAGTWKLDPQFADLMGSAYLLAHGLGAPVPDVTQTLAVPTGGVFRVFVRTRDWVAPHGIGRFQLMVNGAPLQAAFGTAGNGAWIWQDGGSLTLPAGVTRLALHDLTGFDGRCDAIAFRRGADATPPPSEAQALQAFRRQALGWPAVPPEASYDLVVVGAGVAGLCAATAGAREGLRVALVDLKPMLGGNVATGVKPSGGDYTQKGPYRATGRLVEECSKGTSYDRVIAAETNITLCLNTLAYGVRMNTGVIDPGGTRKDPVVHPESVHVAGVGTGSIAGVFARNLVSGRELLLRAPLFVDATGDGTLGFLAGAEYRYGREARGEYGESLAPVVPDRQIMGVTIYWQAATNRAAGEVPFPDCSSWAGYAIHESRLAKFRTLGSWNFEAGFLADQVGDFETVRDLLLRTAYGTWSWAKHESPDSKAFRQMALTRVRYLAGKRESRRLVGDVILTEHDVIDAKHAHAAARTFADGCVPLGWPIDLHFPRQPEGFKSVAPELQVGAKNIDTPTNPAALIPYRCLYSTNVVNLFMAGRDISVTHVALGTTRIQKCGGMQGAVVGRAAAFCRTQACLPRDIYAQHWAAFAQRLEQPLPPVVKR